MCGLNHTRGPRISGILRHVPNSKQKCIPIPHSQLQHLGEEQKPKGVCIYSFSLMLWIIHFQMQLFCSVLVAQIIIKPPCSSNHYCECRLSWSVKNVSITGKVCFQKSIYEKLCKVTRTKFQTTCRTKYISIELIMLPPSPSLCQSLGNSCVSIHSI